MATMKKPGFSLPEFHVRVLKELEFEEPVNTLAQVTNPTFVRFFGKADDRNRLQEFLKKEDVEESDQPKIMRAHDDVVKAKKIMKDAQSETVILPPITPSSSYAEQRKKYQAATK